MNKHFEDTRYYLKRASETASRGVREELEPIVERFRRMTGRGSAPDPGRIERVRADLRALQGRAEGEAKAALADARARLRQFRQRRPA